MKAHKIQELKDLIRNHLNECDRTNLPTICDMKATQVGYNQLEQMIINRIAEQGLTIGDALIQIENEYRTNPLD